MRDEYDFLQSVQNPYLKKLKKPVTKPEPPETPDRSIRHDDNPPKGI